MNKFIIKVIALCVPYGFATAESLTPDKLMALSIEELLQVEVTGSTFTLNSQKTVPSTVTVFTHRQIKQMGLDTLDELMNIVPGFQSYRTTFSSMAYVFSSRGRRIGDPASEVLVLVDGQRIEEPGTGGSAQVVPKFPLMQIEKVEFIRGPGSAVHGSNAMMGIINITTRRYANEFTIGYGSFNRKQANLFISPQLEAFTLDLFVHYEQDEGDNYQLQNIFNGQSVTSNDPRRLTDLNAKLSWQQTQINIQHNQYSSQNYYELGRVSNEVNNRSAQLSSISLKQQFSWLAVDSWFWLSYSQTKFNITGQVTPENALTPISNPSSTEPLFVDADFDHYKEVRTQWHNDYQYNNAVNFQLGIEFRYITVPTSYTKNNFDLGQLVSEDFPINYYGEMRPTTAVQLGSKRNILGVYSQYQHTFKENTHLTLGLRYDSFSELGSKLSPRLALVQSLTPQQSVKLLYGHAFRAPTEAELNLVNNPNTLGNPQLKSETSKALELIWLGQWHNTNVSASLFENRFEDAIVQVNVAPGSEQVQYQNVDHPAIRGLEFELTYELNRYWYIRTSYAYFDDKSDFSFHEANQMGSLLTNFNYSSWNANVIATRQGEREMPANATGEALVLEPFWRLFGKINYNVNYQWQVMLQAKNALNELLLTPSSSSALSVGTPSRGIELLLAVKYKY